MIEEKFFTTTKQRTEIYKHKKEQQHQETFLGG